MSDKLQFVDVQPTELTNDQRELEHRYPLGASLECGDLSPLWYSESQNLQRPVPKR
jgi:hypothetical protein